MNYINYIAINCNQKFARTFCVLLTTIRDVLAIKRYSLLFSTKMKHLRLHLLKLY